MNTQNERELAQGEEVGSADRRAFLRTAGVSGATALAGAAYGKFALAPVTPAQAAGSASPPKLSEQKWWPSKWGADDEAGASNHMTPAKVLESIKWIKEGKVYKLGHDYESGMPLFGKRSYTLRILGGPTGGPFGENRLAWISTEGEFPNIRNANRFTRLKNFAVAGRPIGALMETCA